MSLQTYNKLPLRFTALAVMSLVPSLLYAATDVGTLFDFSHVLAYVVAAMLIGVFVLIFSNRLYVYREREADDERRSQNARLALVLQTSKLRLWLYEPATRHYIILSETGEHTDEYNPIDFSQFYDRDDFEELRSVVFDICENKRLTSTVTVRSNPSKGGRQRFFEVNVSVSRRDAKGRVTQLLGIQHDMTEEYEKKQHVNKLLMRYHTVFNSSLIDMIYYDKDGVLTDINETACQTFGVTNREQVLNGQFRIQDNALFNNIDLSRSEMTRTTSIVNFSDLKAGDGKEKPFGMKGKMFYESTINPIRNNRGELEGIYMAGRNVTEMVESFHHQQEGAIQLKKAIKNVQEYIDNINYSMQVSDARLVNYYPDRYTLEISSEANQTYMQMSQLRCIRLATPRYRRVVSSVLNRMDHHTKFTIEQIIETEIRDKKGRQICMMFSMVPLLDAEGRVERYFGMCRIMTDMVETERQLAIETRKAQEAELVKSSFLTNMSYEIRTPLNTVLGFAELFEQDHDTEDEPVFVNEIKKNTNSLLQLINDILFLSRLDANMIEYNRQPTDFAEMFNAYCQMAWSGVKPNVKTLIENPYEHLVLNIDINNLGQVIQKLCVNAVNFTHEGSIRARYEYRHGELDVIIEDTGVGIDQETLPHVFDRFARNKNEELCGTGLDLPIAQTLIQQMGGTIELQSELKKGTTAWITLPCEATVIDKKRGIN